MQYKINADVSDSDDDFPPLPVLRRTLSVGYLDHNGQMSHDDPSSYTGIERYKRENSVLNQFPHSGYSSSIRIRRAKIIHQFFRCSDEVNFLNTYKKNNNNNKDYEDENGASGVCPSPCAA